MAIHLMLVFVGLFLIVRGWAVRTEDEAFQIRTRTNAATARIGNDEDKAKVTEARGKVGNLSGIGALIMGAGFVCLIGGVAVYLIDPSWRRRRLH